MTSNTKLSSKELTATIYALQSDRSQVEAVKDIIGEPATAKIKLIDADIAKAQDELSIAVADEMEAVRKDNFANFSDLSVDCTYRAGAEDNLLAASFVIHYTRNQYNMRYAEGIPIQHECNGFGVLPNDVFDYMLEVQPEAIPADIMTLAPGNPRDAFARYFQAQRRGYLSA